MPITLTANEIDDTMAYLQHDLVGRDAEYHTPEVVETVEALLRKLAAMLTEIDEASQTV